MKTKRAQVSFEIPLGCRAQEFEAIQGLWHQGIDRMINFGDVWDPGLTFGWFNLELGGGKGCLPERQAMWSVLGGITSVTSSM